MKYYYAYCPSRDRYLTYGRDDFYFSHNRKLCSLIPEDELNNPIILNIISQTCKEDYVFKEETDLSRLNFRLSPILYEIG